MDELQKVSVAPSAPQESAEPAKSSLVKETKYSIRVTREFVDNVEKRIGMGRNAWDMIDHRQLCEEVIAEYQAQSAPPESAEEAWKRGKLEGFNEGVEVSAAVHDAAATNYRRNRLLTDEGIQALWAAIIRQLKHPSDRSEQE